MAADMRRRGKQAGPLNPAKIIKRSGLGGKWAENHESPHSLPINNPIG